MTRIHLINPTAQENFCLIFVNFFIQCPQASLWLNLSHPQRCLQKKALMTFSSIYHEDIET